MDRLQRYEMVDGDAYCGYRSLEKVVPYTGQRPDEGDEWCNAEAVAKLEDALQEAARLLDDVQNGNKWWTAIAEFVKEHKKC